MLEDIKDAVENFKNSQGQALSERDLMGINKIHFELDLLQRLEVKVKKRGKSSEDEADQPAP